MGGDPTSLLHHVIYECAGPHPGTRVACGGTGGHLQYHRRALRTQGLVYSARYKSRMLCLCGIQRSQILRSRKQSGKSQGLGRSWGSLMETEFWFGLVCKIYRWTIILVAPQGDYTKATMLWTHSDYNGNLGGHRDDSVG